MPYVTANGVRLYVEHAGAGDPILGIHGTASSAMAWVGAVPKLADLGRAIVYDRRGCTRSDRPTPYITSIGEQADDAAALLDALHASPAIVIGRSYGGEVAIELALRHPRHVRALVLLEADVTAIDAGSRAWVDRIRKEVERAAEDDPARASEALLRIVLGDDGWDGLPGDWRAMFEANAAAVLAELRGPMLAAGADDLARIDAPTLVVTGADSAVSYRRMSERMVELMPNARLRVVPGGHLLDPAGPDVLAFVREVLAAG